MQKGILVVLAVVICAIFYYSNSNNIETHAVVSNKTDKRHEHSKDEMPKNSIGDSKNDAHHDHDHTASAKSSPNKDHDENHSHIPKDVKHEMCKPSSDLHECEIDVDRNFVGNLITEKGLLKATEIGVLLGSSNFDQVIDKVSSTQKSDAMYVKEQEFLNELSTVTSDIEGGYQNRLACQEGMCALSLITNNQTTWDKFKEGFLAKNGASKGNVFISQSHLSGEELETRILFFPGNNNSVAKRL